MDDEERLQSVSFMAHHWMDNNYVSQLFERLTPQFSEDIDTNIIGMLSELVRRFHNPNITSLPGSLIAAGIAKQILSLMPADLKMHSKSIVFTEGTNLPISAIDSSVRKGDTNQHLKEEITQLECTILPIDKIAGLHKKTPDLVDFLKDPGPLEGLYLTWTSRSPPLGMARLKTGEQLPVLLETKKRYVEKLVLELDLINFRFERVKDLNATRQAQVTRKGNYGQIPSTSNMIRQSGDHQLIVAGFTQTNDEWKDYVTVMDTVLPNTVIKLRWRLWPTGSPLEGGDTLCVLSDSVPSLPVVLPLCPTHCNSWQNLGTATEDFKPIGITKTDATADVYPKARGYPTIKFVTAL